MKSYWLLFLAVVLQACAGGGQQQHNAQAAAIPYTVATTPYGYLPDSIEVTQYTLTAPTGFSVSVLNYGGIITRIMAPDRNGQLGDVVLGYDRVEDYVAASPYFGALIGRYGNRIARGQFNLSGITYKLATNNGANHLHGGHKGFDKVMWSVTHSASDRQAQLVLTRTSPDGEEGYPGNLKVRVTYTVKDSATLELAYQATTDQATVLNLTNHSYFNLSGGREPITGHELTIAAGHYLPVDSTLIPAGPPAVVAGTPFNFNQAKPIGRDITQSHRQLRYGGGYDHCWVLNEPGPERHFAARLYHAATGRQMDVYTTEPALQFYSGNFLDGANTGKGGVVYQHRWGLCLETQHYPDSPNRPDFPSVVLQPGQTYTTQTAMLFTVQR